MMIVQFETVIINGSDSQMTHSYRLITIESLHFCTFIQIEMR